MVLDADARVTYASPNAVSALHRVGINANAIGLRLAELGFHDAAVRQAFERRQPVSEEFDQTPEITLVTRCLPLLAGDAVTGGVLSGGAPWDSNPEPADQEGLTAWTRWRAGPLGPALQQRSN